MNRRSMLTTSVPMVLAAALLPSSVVAQEKSLKDQLVGTWIFVSAQDVKPDGTKVDPWGPNPKGVAMYDAKGRFTFMIALGSSEVCVQQPSASNCRRR